MLENLKRKRRAKSLIQLIESEDLKLWPKLRPQLRQEDLTEPLVNDLCALELCCNLANARLLQELLNLFPELCYWVNASNEPLYARVFVDEERGLGLLAAMLSSGLNPNASHKGQSLVEHALRCEPKNAMLLISRLAQHQADLENPNLVRNALLIGDQALVKFLIDSGAPLAIETSGSTENTGITHSVVDDIRLDMAKISTELLSFAKRCAEDKKLRDLWR